MQSCKGWTYGAEIEGSDFLATQMLEYGYKFDERDVTMVNSNGIAVDPKRKLYGYGGEINMEPGESPEHLTDLFELLLSECSPNMTVNHRSNLHVHVRIPGLITNLTMLKRLQRCIHHELPKVLNLIEPIPVPVMKDYDTCAEFAGAKRRHRRRKVSHRTFLTPQRLFKQLDSQTIEEFFRNEVPRGKDGTPHWACQPRLCVNLRQLRETDTVEFRHFPGTVQPTEFLTAVEWCRDFLLHALTESPIARIYQDSYRHRPFPVFPPYVHWREVRYRATCHDGTVPKATIAENIQLILKGKFDDN